jgi:hypothetical protein
MWQILIMILFKNMNLGDFIKLEFIEIAFL